MLAGAAQVCLGSSSPWVRAQLGRTLQEMVSSGSPVAVHLPLHLWIAHRRAWRVVVGGTAALGQSPW
jgi:hypothetical protein